MIRKAVVAICTLATLSALLSGCSQAPSRGAEAEAAVTAQGAPAATIRLTSTPRQRMAGFGMAVASEAELDPWSQGPGANPAELRTFDKLVLRAGIRLVRIFAPGQSAGPARVQVWTRDDGRLRLMRRLAGRGVRFVMTGQGAPAELVQGGGLDGALTPGGEAAYAAFLAECLEVAQRAGTPFEYVAVGNELDNPGDPGVSMSPAQSAAVAGLLERQIVRRRLRTKLALGDNLNWQSTLVYAQAQADATARRQVGLLATHAYGGDEARADAPRLAASLDVPLWVTEWVSACPRGDCPDDPSIGFALRWAQEITADLTTGGASAWFMFRGVADATHGPDGAIVVRDRSRSSGSVTMTKRYPIMRQFTVAAPPGARRLQTRADGDAGHGVLAFSRGRGRSAILTNAATTARAVRVVLGNRGGALRVWRTSADEDFRLVTRRRLARGRVDLVLPPASVTTLVLDQKR